MHYILYVIQTSVREKCVSSHIVWIIQDINILLVVFFNANNFYCNILSSMYFYMELSCTTHSVECSKNLPEYSLVNRINIARRSPEQVICIPDVSSATAVGDGKWLYETPTEGLLSMSQQQWITRLEIYLDLRVALFCMLIFISLFETNVTWLQNVPEHSPKKNKEISHQPKAFYQCHSSNGLLDLKSTWICVSRCIVCWFSVLYLKRTWFDCQRFQNIHWKKQKNTTRCPRERTIRRFDISNLTNERYHNWVYETASGQGHFCHCYLQHDRIIYNHDCYLRYGFVIPRASFINRYYLNQRNAWMSNYIHVKLRL